MVSVREFQTTPSAVVQNPPSRILVVEDDFVIRMMLAEMLTEEGFAVTEAGNGDEALPMLLAGGFALLVTDIQVPGTLDGRALVAAAREAGLRLPVIYTSGLPSVADEDESGVVVLAKPYQHEEIVAAIHRLLPA